MRYSDFATMVSLGRPTLKYGSKGGDVVALQVELQKVGAQIVADGDFGAKTLAAVKAYQQSRGLKVDGIVGPAVWAALESGAPVIAAPPSGGGNAPIVLPGPSTLLPPAAARVMPKWLGMALLGGLAGAMVLSFASTSRAPRRSYRGFRGTGSNKATYTMTKAESEDYRQNPQRALARAKLGAKIVARQTGAQLVRIVDSSGKLLVTVSPRTGFGAAAVNGNRKVTIKKVDGEYVVKLWINGKHYEPADYFTDDKDDAQRTAQTMVQG